MGKKIRNRNNFWWMFLANLVVCVFFKMQFVYGQSTTVLKNPHNITYLQTDDNVKFGIWGKEPKKATPVMFILSSTIEESLGSTYFRQCGDYFGREKGWLCVSIDLPFHGRLKRSGYPSELSGWANAVMEEEDFVTENNKRMSSVLDYLLRKGWVHPDSIMVCGTSRGGYLALQYGTSDSRVNSILVFSPVTDLLKLREFESLGQEDLLPGMDLTNHIVQLTQKNIWVAIGDQDKRVGSGSVVSFINDLLNERYNQKSKTSLEFNLMHEPLGHTTPKGALERSIWWLSQIINSYSK